MRLSSLEKRVLTDIAATHAQGDIILAQLARATVDQRERSATGFRTFFAIDAVGRHLDKRLWKTEHMPALNAWHPELRAEVIFTLVIADGFISCLEGRSHAEPWPGDEAQFVTQ